MTAESCLEAVRARLATDGCTVTAEHLGSTPVTVGYKAQFKALTKMHIFTVAAAVERVDETAVRSFTDAVTQLARNRKGQWRGAQSGVLVLPILIASVVDPSAIVLTAKPYRLHLDGFAVMANPAIVDATSGAVHTFRGRRIWGYVYNGMIKKKLALYLPAVA
jgi:hypothetical protein